MPTILVTGGAGYIGSHTVVELLAQNYTVVIVDNFCNSKPSSLARIEQISGKAPIFYQVDVRDELNLSQVFVKHKIDAVIHFAALKAVGESVREPARYYENNVAGSLVLFKVMAAHQVKSIVFSSSATVYGDTHSTPIH